MDTHGKFNVEFYSEVQEILARHESSFNKINATLQTVLIKLQMPQTLQTLLRDC